MRKRNLPLRCHLRHNPLLPAREDIQSQWRNFVRRRSFLKGLGMVGVWAGLPVDAATLKGVVIAKEMGGSGMDNVPVSVDEAGANSTVSKGGGEFVFEFPEKKAGEVVHVRINKEGYVVVNDVQLEVTLPINPDAKPLAVILCPEDEREKWAGLLYRVIIDKATEEKYQQKLKALEEKYQAEEAALAAEKAGLQKERAQCRIFQQKSVPDILQEVLKEFDCDFQLRGHYEQESIACNTARQILILQVGLWRRRESITFSSTPGAATK
jgi:hypothetical protein